MKLIVLTGIYSIYKFRVGSVLPDWIYSSDFYSITRTTAEVSVVTSGKNSVSPDIICSKEWRIFKIDGPLDFSLVGIIAGISDILKKKQIPIFTISTYDTDYILVKEEHLDPAKLALREKGHIVTEE
jgi:uncharacterized protein